jgi:hypothetical protein
LPRPEPAPRRIRSRRPTSERDFRPAS